LAHRHALGALALVATLAIGVLPASRAAHGAQEKPQLTIHAATDAYRLAAILAFQYGQAHPELDLRAYTSDSRTPHCGFAGDIELSNAYLSDDELRGSWTSGCLNIPIAVGAVPIVYNLPGDYFTARASDGSLLHPLRLTARVVAGVYLGTIARWDDPAIAALNPGAPLPARAIQAIDDTEPSGGRAVVSGWLASANVGWTTDPITGTVARRPDYHAVASAGVMSRFIQQLPYSLGFISLDGAARDGLRAAALQNAAAQFVTPSPASLAAAVAGTLRDGLPRDFRRSLVTASDPGAFAPSYVVYAVVHRDQLSAPRDGQAVEDLLSWMLDDAGGQQVIAGLGYIPISCARAAGLPCGLADVARAMAVASQGTPAAQDTGTTTVPLPPTAPATATATPTPPIIATSTMTPTASMTTPCSGPAQSAATLTPTTDPATPTTDPATPTTATLTPAIGTPTQTIAVAATIAPTGTLTPAGTLTPLETPMPLPTGTLTPTPIAAVGTAPPRLTVQACAGATPLTTGSLTPTLDVRVDPRMLAVGGTLVVRVHTAPRARIDITLRLPTGQAGHTRPRVARRPPAGGASDAAGQIQNAAVLATQRGASDRHGWLTRRLHPTFAIARPTEAFLSVTATMGRRATTRVARLLLLPEPAQRAPGREHVHVRDAKGAIAPRWPLSQAPAS